MYFNEKKMELLDKTKVSWYSESHSSSSMLKIGVYPEGTAQKLVQEKVNGTFGGRFNTFGNGRFIFVAYTD